MPLPKHVNSPSASDSKEVPEVPAEKLAEKDLFQHYKSARTSVRLITTKGKRITFAGYEFLTQDEDVIEYLDHEIKNGLPGITKGKLMTVEESDPMSHLKRKHIAEYLEEEKKKQAALAMGILPNMGNTKEQAQIDSSVKPASSKTVAS